MDQETGAALKERQRAVWSAGHYDAVAELIQDASDQLVEHLEIDDGQTVLDVACGTGNASVPAAERGARVSALDLTPKLIELARERASTAGLEIDFVEGDAENLPYDDGSFDRVMSVFGTMFAPDHGRTAAELVRVCAPGGRVGVCAWTPEGINGQMFATVGAHMPPPPPGFAPPSLWGNEEHVRELFAPSGGELGFERLFVDFEFDSTEDWTAFGEENLGPVTVAKAVLEPQGKWEKLRQELLELYNAANEGAGGAMRVPAEYLRTTVLMPG